MEVYSFLLLKGLMKEIPLTNRRMHCMYQASSQRKAASFLIHLANLPRTTKRWLQG